MKVLTVRRVGLLLLGAALALAPVLAEAAARGARGGGGGASRSAGVGGGGARATRTATRAPAPSAGRATSAARTTAPRGGKQTASGRATYGYYNGGYGYYPGYGYGYGYYPGYYPGYWDPWYWGSSWGVSFSFGWPYYGYAPYGWEYPYGYVYPEPYVYEGAPVAAPAVPAALEIDVKPYNARVILNGEDVGRGKDYDGRWDRLRVPAGRQWIELKAEGYQTLRLAVDAEGGGLHRLAYALEKGEGIDPRSQDPAALPAPPAPVARLEKGLLRLVVAPADATVYLDGEYFARADEVARLRGAIPLAAGEHRIEVVRPGFAPQTIVVNVESGGTATASVALDPGN